MAHPSDDAVRALDAQTWARAFTQWLETLATGFHEARDRARARGDTPRVDELTNALERIPSIRGTFADAPDGAKLAMRVLDLSLTLTGRDLERAARNYRDAVKAAPVKASQVAAIKRQQGAADRHQPIYTIAAGLDPDLTNTAKARLVRKKLKHPLSLDYIRHLLADPKK